MPIGLKLCRRTYAFRALTQLQCAGHKTKCAVLQKASQTKAELADLFKTVQKNELLASFFAGNPFFTWEHFVSSFVAVSGRCFRVNITETHGLALLGLPRHMTVGKQMFFMAPFADLLNHHNSFPAMQSSYRFNDQAQALEFFADQDYARGDQVQILPTSTACMTKQTEEHALNPIHCPLRPTSPAP